MRYSAEEMAIVLRLQSKGKLTVGAIIKEARRPGSPLAKRFSLEWSEKAHLKLLKVEARQYIATIKVVMVNALGEEIRVRQFESLPTDRKRPGGGYTNIETIRTHHDLTADLRRDLVRELKRVSDRFSFPFPEEAVAVAELAEKLETAENQRVGRRKGRRKTA